MIKYKKGVIIIEVHMREAMNDFIIDEAVKLFNLDFIDRSEAKGFENFIYTVKKADVDYVLRFVHSDHREFNQILAEIEFIDYLYKNGANVAQIIKSKKRKISEKISIDKDTYFTVTMFEMAPGTYVKRDEVTPHFQKMFGGVVGRLHRLTKNYKPKHRRPHWYEDSLFVRAKEYLKEEDYFVLDKLNETIEAIKSLPSDKDSYGLIHTDLHFGNMYYHNGRLMIFDWDDSSYKHFMSDIAIIIFYMLGMNYDLDDDQKADYTSKFFDNFCLGYLEENSMKFSWFEHLNTFLKLRELILYCVIHLEGDEFLESEWAISYIKHYRDRIKNDIPFFDLKKAINKKL